VGANVILSPSTSSGQALSKGTQINTDRLPLAKGDGGILPSAFLINAPPLMKGMLGGVDINHP